MSVTNGHMGRAWSGHSIEDACPCPQEECGLVSTPDPSCGQHAYAAGKSMRQIHSAENCPSKDEAAAKRFYYQHFRNERVLPRPWDLQSPYVQNWWRSYARRNSTQEAQAGETE